MPQPVEYYGVIKLSECYHSRADCPAIRRGERVGNQVTVKEYGTEANAVAAGHIRKCGVCLSGKTFAISGKKDRIRISGAQFSVLRIIADIHSKTGPMTLQEISERRNRSVVSTYLVVKRLLDGGLVSHKLKIGGRRASGGTIEPTPLGVEVSQSEAIPERRKVKSTSLP